MFHVKHRLIRIYQDFLCRKFNASAQQLDTIDLYCEAIKQWSRRQNIVSKHDLEYLYPRHVMPSAFIAAGISSDPARQIADIGSGSGFPGIIIKILLPEKSMTLIDSSRRKYLFLLELCESLSIDCKVIHGRFENLAGQMKMTFDLIVSRAVASPDSLWKWSERLLSPGGSLYVLKGGEINHELVQLNRISLTVDILKPDAEWRDEGCLSGNKFVIHMRR